MRACGAIALAAAGLVACASPRVQKVEDAAAPRVYGENEVEVPARPLTPIRAAYPRRLQELRVEGDVAVLVTVWPDGSVAGAQLLASSHSDFTAAAREALRVARFSPGLVRGQPVPSRVVVELHFRLP